MSDKLLVGQVLKALRLHLGLTQREFANKLGWSPQRISYLEVGKFHPSIESLFLIAEVSGIDASKIIRNIERRKKSLRLHE